MDAPICVIDAKTLVDHIQDVKFWIYHRQLRLVVPSCTTDQVEHLFQKAIEVKPIPPEQSRAKSFGRQLKKDYPTFDINPRLAKDFLTRIEICKASDEPASAEQRDFYREKENHDSLDFQRPSEQYTPWKDCEIEEEEVEPSSGGPTSWAEALRRKANLANGTLGDSQAPKGPAKPKLVARAPGSDQSPWKIKRDAPKVSAKDVPSALRPLMSCTLWRLHEHIDRNDANELFLLSDQPEIRAVATKLNIICRSTQELRNIVASRVQNLDIAFYGDLEREFGDKEQSFEALRLTHLEHALGGTGTVQLPVKADESRDVGLNGATSSQEIDRVNSNEIVHSDDNQSTQLMGEANVGGNARGEKASPTVNGVGGKADGTDMSVLEGTPSTKLAWSAVVKNGLQTIKKDAGATNSNGSKIDKAHEVPVEESQKKIDSAPIPPRRDSISTQGKATRLTESSQEQHSPFPSDTITNPTIDESKGNVSIVDEPDDSDEEVVVFKPSTKRYSTQKKPVQQSSRPSTPISTPQPRASTPVAQSQPGPPVEIPIFTAAKPQPHQRPGSSRGRNPMLVGHGHPQAKSSPTVIDPDAFGRSFAVNPNPSPHNHYGHVAHAMNRPPVNNGQHTHNSRSPRRQHGRNGSGHVISYEVSQRLSPAPEANLRKEMRKSPSRRSREFESENGDSASFDPTPGAQRRPITPASKAGNIDDIARRSAIPEKQARTRGNRNTVTNLTPPSLKVQVLPRTILSSRKPFDTVENNIPQQAVSQTLYKPQAPDSDYVEPRAAMPDVQYILKSGSTRESARGQGRLWMPS